MLDLLSNAPRPVRFGQRSLQVGALKIREIGLLQRWIRDHAVRPSERLKADLAILPEEDHRRLRYEAAIAERNWPPNVNTPEGNAVLFGDPDGQLYFLGVMLRKFQPDLDDAVLDEVAAGLSDLDFVVLQQIAFGEDDLDPKEVRAEILARLAKLKDLAEAARNSPPTSSDSSTPGADTGPTGPDSLSTSG